MSPIWKLQVTPTRNTYSVHSIFNFRQILNVIYIPNMWNSYLFDSHLIIEEAELLKIMIGRRNSFIKSNFDE